MQEEIREVINKADKIFILGYGFDKFNNKVLFGNEQHMRSLFEHCEVFSTGKLDDTTLGWLNSIADEISTFDGGGAKKVVAIKDENCTELLSSRAIKKSFF